MRKSIHPFWAALAISISLCVSAPLNIISNNIGEYLISSYSIFIIALLSAFLFIFIISLTILFFLFKISILIRRIILALIISVSVWLHYVPLFEVYLDGIDVAELSTIGLAAGGVAFIFSFFVPLAAIPILIFVTVGPLFTAIISLVDLPLSSDKFPEKLPISSVEPNLFLIGIDGLQTETLRQSIERNPDFSSRLQGFEFWTNTLSVGPHTRLSLPMIKIGRIPKDQKELIRDEGVLKTILNDAGMRIQTTRFYDLPRVEGEIRIPESLGLPNNSSIEYFRALDAALSRLNPERSFGILNKIQTKVQLLQIQDDWTKKFVKEMYSDKNVIAFRKSDLINFKYIIDNIDFDNGAGTANLFHFLFNHDPMNLDQYCNFHLSTQVDQREFVGSQTDCALSKVLDFLEVLMRQNIYDRSMIIIYGDHGLECRYQDDNSVQAAKVSKRWCLSRYESALLLKGPLSTGDLALRSEGASLLDISSTICEWIKASHVETDCSEFEGIDLLGSPTSQESLRPVFIQKKGDKFWSRDDYEVIYVGRDDKTSAILEMNNFE